MNQKERKAFEKLLLSKKETLLKELGIIEDSTFNKTAKDASGDISAYAFHAADQATDFQEREKSFLFAAREGRFLHHLDEALIRVKSKDYGVCFECSKNINPERLEAVPHARLCMDCKSKEEIGKKKKI